MKLKMSIEDIHLKYNWNGGGTFSHPIPASLQRPASRNGAAGHLRIEDTFEVKHSNDDN